MIRVGLALWLGESWQGGVSYFRNLLRCYNSYPDPEVKICVFTLSPEDVERYRSDAIEVHPCPELLCGPREYTRRAMRRLLGFDPEPIRIMKRHRIDLLTHLALGRQTRVNTLQWQPDFQHKVLPGYFSPEDCARRDSLIADVQLWGNILLSSNAAARDFRHFYPELAQVKTHVLHFSSAEVLKSELLSRAELEARYPVHEPYFFLPNQFWQHKNHAVVVEALRQVPAHIRVICTGLMEDYRNVAHLPALLDKVKQAGLQQRFICLGLVPYASMVSLMHHAIAVLQPSLFEGWSTSVEEAKAMCKQIILSDIDVHLEQAPERGVYFSPKSAEELAAQLVRIYDDFSPAVEEGFVERRQQHRIGIERDWVGNFAQIIKEVAGTG